MKAHFKSMCSALKELGMTNSIIFLVSFIAIFLFEDIKQSTAHTSAVWLATGIVAYALFGFYFGWFFATILPKNFKRQRILFYLQQRASDISVAISGVLLDLLIKAGDENPNERDRPINEMIEICERIDPYQKFKSHFERNEDYQDFYEYFSFISSHVNAITEKILVHADVLSAKEIQILLDLEKSSNSALTKNIKLSSGSVASSIPEPYAREINNLREDSKALLESFGIPLV